MFTFYEFYKNYSVNLRFINMITHIYLNDPANKFIV